MPNKQANIALLTPSAMSFSETFIEAHISMLNGNIFHYYGNLDNKYLEGFGSLRKTRREFYFRILRLLKRKSYTWYLNKFLEHSFRKNNINVVLAEYGDTAVAHLPLIKRMNLPLIVHFHGYDASIYEMFELTDNYKDIFKTATFIVTVSQKMCKRLTDAGCPKEKIVYNVCGPRDSFLLLSPKFLGQQFLAAGRFVDKKAPHYLILSFYQVVKKFPEAKLIMAGSGVLKNACEDLVRYYGLEKNIFFVGVLSKESLQKHLEDSIAFIQHSITAENGDEEGTPLTILEASAAGLPVISTIHGGIPDVIKDGETGFLVKEHDVTGMAEKMIFVLENKDEVKKMGAKGKKNIRENFTLKKHINKLDDIIAKAIN